MARKRKKNKSSGSSGGWLTTFSDLMSLLLTFFILLFSMSSVSAEKFQAAAQSIQYALLGADGSTILDGSALNEESAPGKEMMEEAIAQDDNAIPEEVLEMYEQVITFLEENGIESQVAVSRDQDGIYVNIQESILFNMGRAEVTDSGKSTLNIIAELLNTFDNDVVVEGYTDDVPINTRQYESNWELSTARAISVLRYLSEEKSVAPTRLSAKGYGEYSPVVPNDSPENKAKNRRVNVAIVYDREEESAQ